jgi:RNA polymerase sigma factor (sigma-70 family)
MPSITMLEREEDEVKSPNGDADGLETQALLSDEPTIELVIQAKAGSRVAVEALLERCLPQLQRWAHGRMPAVARGSLDTSDLVNDAAMHLLQRIDLFRPQHVGALQAYLRQSIVNRIRDEVRRVNRRPEVTQLTEDCCSDSTSPIEVAIREEVYEHYRQALGTLTPKDREIVIARVEAQWSHAQIAERFGLPTVAAASMAISRALRRLTEKAAAYRRLPPKS